MAGHSQFKNIMHRKGRQDAVKARAFAKIAREIMVAAKNGLPDPAANPRLRAAMQEARVMNMPRERIERAIKAATSGTEGANYEEMRYEGYGPGGVALIVEALTDNRNRSAADIRAAFAKSGGSLGETNSVSFLFTHAGFITFPASVASADAMLEAVIDVGGEDVVSDNETHNITVSVQDFTTVRDALEAKFGEAQSAKLGWKPLTLTPIDGEAAESLIKLLDTLEEHDDVQVVTGNYDIAESVLTKLGE